MKSSISPRIRIDYQRTLVSLLAFLSCSPSGLITLMGQTQGVQALPSNLQWRATPDNTVVIIDQTRHCLIVPREAYTDIGDSEQPGGTISYCTDPARDSPEQGLLPSDFWTNVVFESGIGPNGGRYAQLTGCINAATLDRLNPEDGGGQYDSSGGSGGHGNPAGSVCKNYNHYVELIEPDVSRACIRCCEDFDDCPLDQDTSGCPSVIEGNYFDCY